MTGTLLSLGHGYSAKALATLLLSRGWTIIGTTRSAEKAKTLRATGVDPRTVPGDNLTADLARATHLLISASPDENGDPFLPLIFDALKTRKPGWIGYLSTTGVYGDHQGGWVDEDTPCTPGNTRGKWRARAEQQWLDHGAHIFRLAGIYGPGRGPFAKVRNGTARRIIKPNQVFGRIHVDDIAQTVAASIAAPNPGRIYNVCDDEPAPPEDVLGYAAELLGLPLPPEEDFETAEMTPMARSFYAESRRVRSNRIKDELGVTLHYPDYRAGLKALLAAETTA
ncbi:SDR family oxidoreductase [Actibacterium sp. 188UL27-1]|uniref:SDR family oxidoreductase n=1 Tax=Actibacterium sp. 188UL27-1 TaxID=2786961 RepID=UPI00195D80F0|nr:SDR family oxidoreductase [Actibacterium sp. 188UL27-1]MBM7068973.1 SDR family oxidoreductase [Actibacterium sp. 188UL27-1]